MSCNFWVLLHGTCCISDWRFDFRLQSQFSLSNPIFSSQSWCNFEREKLPDSIANRAVCSFAVVFSMVFSSRFFRLKRRLDSENRRSVPINCYVISSIGFKISKTAIGSFSPFVLHQSFFFTTRGRGWTKVMVLRISCRECFLAIPNTVNGD